MMEMDTVVVIVWTPTSRCSAGFDLNLANEMLKMDPNVSVSFQFPQSSLPQTALGTRSGDDRTFVTTWLADGFCCVFHFKFSHAKPWGEGATATKPEATSTDAPSMSNQYDSLMLTKPSQKGDKGLNTPRCRTNNLRSIRTSRGGGGGRGGKDEQERCVCTMVSVTVDQHLRNSASKEIKVESNLADLRHLYLEVMMMRSSRDGSIFTVDVTWIQK